MKRIAFSFALLALTVIAAARPTAQWPAPVAPVISEADGYVAIPNAAITPEKGRVYRAAFDATHSALDPTKLMPALNMAGSELNALAACKVPLKNARFIVVFHGAAINGILNDNSYKAKFGINNPNLKVLTELKKAGVELFVCGQNLAADNIDPKTLSTDVTIASDALIVLMTCLNQGYALMSF
jgi:intracellular sulfur oxidation DsrE/DsrF family protein